MGNNLGIENRLYGSYSHVTRNSYCVLDICVVTFWYFVLYELRVTLLCVSCTNVLIIYLWDGFIMCKIYKDLCTHTRSKMLNLKWCTKEKLKEEKRNDEGICEFVWTEKWINRYIYLSFVNKMSLTFFFCVYLRMDTSHLNWIFKTFHKHNYRIKLCVYIGFYGKRNRLRNGNFYKNNKLTIFVTVRSYRLVRWIYYYQDIMVSGAP